MLYDGKLPNFQNLESTVRRTTKALRPHTDRFDVLAVRGISGQAIGFPVALRLKKRIVVLRRENEYSHDTSRLVGSLRKNDRALFLDDLVESGNTRQLVFMAVASRGGKLVGEYLYDNCRNFSTGLHWAPDWSTGWSKDAPAPF